MPHFRYHQLVNSVPGIVLYQQAERGKGACHCGYTDGSHSSLSKELTTVSLTWNEC